jgi:general secretion pathway protein N
MRVDSLAPKTWLLGAAAAWALTLWVLAMAGMGGRLGEAEDDAAQQRLPTTQLPNGDRPGALTQYSEIAARPLFSERRVPEPFTIDGAGQDAVANPFDYMLTSVLMTPSAQIAILRSPGDGAKPVRVKLGEAVESAPQWSLSKLEPRQAIFVGPEGEKILELRVFNGVGGVMPQVATAPVVPPPPGVPMPQPGIVQNADGTVVPPPSQPMPPPPPPPSTVEADNNVTTQAQLEAIRKRIEARRAQLRQQNQSSQQPQGQ